MSLTRKDVQSLIVRALREDAATADATSRAVIPAPTHIRAQVVARAHGVVAGVRTAARAFTIVDRSVRCRLHVHSGAVVRPGQVLVTVEGRARSIFAAERTALNFLGHLSGIATLTAAYVARVKGTRAKIYDTRKTTPGLRELEKCAVGAGGGCNHRGDLAEAVLIKTNHLRAISHQRSAISQTIQETIRRAKRRAGGRIVEIEVTDLREFRAALEARPHVILLDNWPLARIRQAVALRHSSRITHHSSPLLEVSGGVTLTNVRAIARTGVERISIGRLTHSAPALDVSLVVEHARST
jgi:nicotinate-nucleotide pyrophosphorylase (carboxylating)